MFEKLEAGDVLFIDSSHVAKTGSDVNYLFFEVLPRLRRGVRVHVHDIFLPIEYPRDWVIDENRSWNEQYVLRALLMFSSGSASCSVARMPTRAPRVVASALGLDIDKTLRRRQPLARSRLIIGKQWTPIKNARPSR